MHPAALSSDHLLAQCEIQRTRRTGPGGQHRNKVETAVIITHRPTGTRSEASERRSQAENQRVALFRLRVNLALCLRKPILANVGPSDLWRSRCRGDKIVVNPSHDDFPSLLAEALDILKQAEMDVKRASQQLGCTPTQLLKFLKLEARAFQWLNENRNKHGLPPLK